MILVTGTMRSGTSMWMQILKAAGFPLVGDAFPEPWGERLRAANPKGFYESQLAAGIYHATNPHPDSGAFLFPEQCSAHAVKVFVPGLLRTDLAYIDRVVATVRNWRQYSASMDRMARISGDGPGEDRESKLFDLPLSSAHRWWFENFALVRDIALRQHPAHVCTYDRLLADPDKEIGLVMRWLGDGDADAACEAVDPGLRSQGAEAPTPEGVEPEHAEVFDLLYEHLNSGLDLEPSFVDLLNSTDRELRPLMLEARDQAREDLLQQLVSP